ncbi:MAG: helix-turn-helix domain-containing protein [Candidatus Peribacteraceae bacterium]|nr:helix-turn-helix domain-containing protein [Candidatus Peribacteraceae bacterium]
MGITKTTQEFYSLSEVAKRLGLSKMTIYRYVKAKKLSAYQFGRDFRVRAEDLERFIQKFKV